MNQFTHWVRQLKQSSKTLRKTNSSDTFVLSLLTSSIVVIIVLKWVALVWRKTDFDQSIWPAGNQRNHHIYDSKLPWTRVLKELLAQGWQQSFWKFPILSIILDLKWYLATFLIFLFQDHGCRAVGSIISADFSPAVLWFCVLDLCCTLIRLLNIY